MKRLAVLLVFAGLAACSDPNDFEVDAVTACEMLLQDNLVSSRSFETHGIWSFSQVGRIGTVRRNYSAQNSFGATVDASYTCKFDADAQRVVALSTIGPLGVNVIVQDQTAAREAARLTRVQEGAERALANTNQPQPTGSGERRWVTNLSMTGCPAASDWFAAQDAVSAGRWDVDLPDRCFQIQPGTVIRTPPEGSRESVVHKGHAFEKGTLGDGREFWTDEMDRISLSPL